MELAERRAGRRVGNVPEYTGSKAKTRRLCHLQDAFCTETHATQSKRICSCTTSPSSSGLGNIAHVLDDNTKTLIQRLCVLAEALVKATEDGSTGVV